MIHLVCPNPAIDRTLLIETIETAIPNRPIAVREFPGGKSFNVAYALSYGERQPEITIHTMLGGTYGAHVLQLAKEKDYHLHVTQVEKNTRICNILVDTSNKKVVPIYENGFDLTSDLLATFTENLLSAIHGDDLLVFSGSLMKGMPSNYIAELDKKLKRLAIRCKLCIDTSGEALVSTYEETAPFLIKINDEETHALFPEKKLCTPNDYLDLLRNDVRTDIQHFIVTLGKNGVVARMGQHFYAGEVEQVEAKNPIASGDFFLGRLLWGFSNNHSDHESLKNALLFATSNVLNWYPEVTDEQLSAIKPMITVERIEYKYSKARI